MWDRLVRRWRVELALWECYWGAPEGDDFSQNYCCEHSWLVSGFWLLAVTAVMLGLYLLVQGWIYAFEALCR